MGLRHAAVLAASVVANLGNVVEPGAPQLRPRALLNVGPDNSPCPPLPTTTVEVQPVFYSEYFPYNTVIDPFRNGRPIQVTNAPTTVIVSGFLTRTILPTPGNPSANPTAGSSGPAPTASNSGTVSDGGNIGSNSVPSPNLTPGSMSSATSRSASSSITASPTTTSFTTPFSFGQGLPSGSVTSLASDSFLFLAFTRLPADGPVKRQVHRRQGEISGSASASAMAATVVDLDPPRQTDGGSLPPSEYDSSTPLNLLNGSLSGGEFTLNKVFNATGALLGTAIDPSALTVNVTFSLIDGFLSWNTPDRGAADFYLCFGSTIYASFGGEAGDLEACERIDVGAISGQICRDFVAQMRSVNPAFVAPLSTATNSQGSAAPSTLATTGSANPGSRSSTGLPRPPQSTASTGTSRNGVPSASSIGTGPSITPRSTSSQSNGLQIPSGSNRSGSTSTRSTTTRPASSSAVLPTSVILSIQGSSQAQSLSSSNVPPSISSNSFAGQSGQATTTSPQATLASPTSRLPIACQALDQLVGVSVVSQLASCRTSLGPLPSLNAQVATCLATIVSLNTRGADIRACLELALDVTISTGTRLPTLSTPTTSLVATPPTQPELSGACIALQGLTGLQLQTQLALCRASLGSFATSDLGIANCLANTSGSGSDTLQCLVNAILGPSTRTTTGLRPTTTPSISLDAACRAIDGLVGVALVTQIGLCTTNLGPLALNPDVASCLTVPVFSTTGSDIVNCLLDALARSPTSSMMSITRTSILAATPTSIVQIPQSCLQLSGLAGFGVATQLASCTTSLGDLLLRPSVASCVGVIVGSNTVGSDIVLCLDAALALSVPSPSPSTRSIEPSATPVLLPSTCLALGELTGVSLQTQLPLCITSLGNLAALPPVASCINIPIGLNSLGSDLVACLTAALTSAASSTISLTTTSVVAVPTPPVGQLTAACSSLSDLSGLAVATQLALCTTSLGDLVLSLPRVAACVNISVSFTTLGSDIVACLNAALSSSSTSTATTSSRAGAVQPTPSSGLLSSACQALNGLSGLSIAPQLALCTTSLGSLATLPTVASCISGVNIVGADIVTCLINALVSQPSTTRVITPSTRSTGPLPTATNALTSACRDLVGVNGLAVASQLSLCATSLGNLALRSDVALCLAVIADVNTIGSDITNCLQLALSTMLTTSTRSQSLTATATNPTFALPSSCTAISALSGLQIPPQLLLCAASLGGLAQDVDVAACLATSVVPGTVGSDIVQCLVGATGGNNPSITTSRLTPTLPSIVLPSPTLPVACANLANVSGLQISTQLALCSADLGSLALQPRIASCLAVAITTLTVGDDIIDCLISALGPSSTTITASATASISSSTPALCLSALPATCESLALESGLPLLSGLGTCTLSLPLQLRSAPSVAVCLATDVLTLLNGQSVVDCLSAAALCPASSSTSRATVVTGLVTPTPSPAPSCLTQLPTSCNALGGLTGFALTLPFATCLLEITPRVVEDTLTSVTTCLNPAAITSNTQGSAVVGCLTAAALCPGATPSTGINLPTATPTNTPLPVSLPTCLSILPTVCSTISGTGLTALLSPVQACQLALLPQLSLSAQASAGACLAISAILPVTTGADITNCLDTSVLCSTVTTRSASTFSTATRSISPTPSASLVASLSNCLTTLPTTCLAVSTSNGLDLLGPLGLCQASLLLQLTATGLDNALTCLDVLNLLAFPAPRGSDRLTCLQNSVLCGGSGALLPRNR